MLVSYCVLAHHMSNHMSNRYLELSSSVSAIVDTSPGTVSTLVEFKGVPGDNDAQPSIVVYVARHGDVLVATSTLPDAKPGTAVSS